jgi:hypothetical protein
VPALRTVPFVDGLPVVGTHVLVVRTDDAGVEELAEPRAGVEVDCEEGTVRACVGDESVALAAAERGVDFHVVHVHTVSEEVLGDGVCADVCCGRFVEAHELCAAEDGIRVWGCAGGDATVYDPEAAFVVADNVLHIDEAGAWILAGGTVLDGCIGPGFLVVEGSADDDVTGGLSSITGVCEVKIVIDVYR